MRQKPVFQSNYPSFSLTFYRLEYYKEKKPGNTIPCVITKSVI